MPGLSLPWTAAPVPAPELLVLNEELAAELGVDAAALREPAGVALLVGHGLPDGVTPVAQAYAGHQFGQYVPRLGDGRALLLGEVIDTAGRRRDLHLKGSGRTPFARGGDGKAAVGPMLREYLIGEAMHGLGIPTTRALAVVATGERVLREERPLPGAVLCRVAASHLRVGTFQFAAATGDRDLLRRLADHAIARHHPEAADAAQPYLELYRRVVEAQAELVARWMLVGFIHGVMNTDNMTISGETIDYGPCAFIDAFDPATVFSSIDHRRPLRLRQPARDRAVEPRAAGRDAAAADRRERRRRGRRRHRAAQRVRRRPTTGTGPTGMAAKLGLTTPDRELVNDLLELLRAQRVDFTLFFRALVGGHRRGRCSPSRAASTRGRRAARRCCPPTGPRWWRPWTGSTPSTSRATTGSRRRSPRPPRATWARSAGCSTSSPGRSRAARAGGLRRPGPRHAPHVTYCGT